ncbi:hypothetical protein [Phenylobacterium sp.]|uniref:hypothetical protein n=1 Tax=Phenylobacterium sp. TaxID=1871053 RepID=UPI0039333072
MIEVVLDGRVVATVPVSLIGLNWPLPSAADYASEAKRCVVEDGTLTMDQVEHAVFRFRRSDA